MHSGPIQLATDNSGVESFWLLARRCGLRIPGVAGRPRRRQQDCTVRTPDVVEFAVSPQAGQASTACPTREALAIERNGSAHFPRRAEIAGRHQAF